MKLTLRSHQPSLPLPRQQEGVACANLCLGTCGRMAEAAGLVAKHLDVAGNQL